MTSSAHSSVRSARDDEIYTINDRIQDPYELSLQTGSIGGMVTKSCCFGFILGQEVVQTMRVGLITHHKGQSILWRQAIDASCTACSYVVVEHENIMLMMIHITQSFEQMNEVACNSRW